MDPLAKHSKKLRSLLQTQATLGDTLAATEDTIYRAESVYLAASAGVVTGFAAALPENTHTTDNTSAPRIFSLSSARFLKQTNASSSTATTAQETIPETSDSDA